MFWEKYSRFEWVTFWTALAAFGTVGTLLMLVIPMTINFYRKGYKKRKLNKFFKYFYKSSFIPSSLVANIDILNLVHKNKSNELIIERLIFYQYKNVFINKSENLWINEILVPRGFHFYEVLNEYCIKLRMINDISGELTITFIYLDYNNVRKNEYRFHPNKEFEEDYIREFNKIVSWDL